MRYCNARLVLARSIRLTWNRDGSLYQKYPNFPKRCKLIPTKIAMTLTSKQCTSKPSGIVRTHLNRCRRALIDIFGDKGKGLVTFHAEDG
jgi:hypothetical protein